MLKLALKTWTSFPVNYEKYNEYRIYDFVRQAVYLWQDVILDETSIGFVKSTASPNSPNQPINAQLPFFKVSIPIIL